MQFTLKYNNRPLLLVFRCRRDPLWSTLTATLSLFFFKGLPIFPVFVFEHILVCLWLEGVVATGLPLVSTAVQEFFVASITITFITWCLL